MADRVVQETYRLGPITHGRDLEFQRGDLEIYGINTFRPSYVAHVFLNDAEVDATNASEDRPSYAGTFALFGHQRCIGDEGHCDVPTEARRFDDRPSHPLTRAFRRVVITDALKRVLAETDQITLTITVTALTDDSLEIPGELLDVLGVQISTFA
jgi:hypothetical protein